MNHQRSINIATSRAHSAEGSDVAKKTDASCFGKRDARKQKRPLLRSPSAAFQSLLILGSHCRHSAFAVARSSSGKSALVSVQANAANARGPGTSSSRE